MKKHIVLFFFTFAIAFCAFFSGCSAFMSDKDKIEARIEKFEDCYNDGDLDGILECLATKERKMIQAELNIFGALMGGLIGLDLDISDLFSLGVGMQDTELINVTIEKIRITDSTTAIAEGSIVLTEGSSSETCLAWFCMVKEEDGWFIEDIIDAPEEEAGESVSA